MNYYKRHLGDYARDTAHLTLAQDGAYNRMLDFYYATEKPLPADKAELYRRVRANSKQDRDAVDVCLHDFFTLQDDGWHHNRCDEEIAAMREKAQTNRENGKGGGRPKTKPKDNPEKTQSVSGGNDDGLRLETLATNPLATNPLATSSTTPQAAPADPDPIFGVCLDFLKGKGVDDRRGRSFLGLMRKQYADTAVFEAVEAARREDVSNPIPWITKALQARQRAGPQSQTAKGMEILENMKQGLGGNGNPKLAS